MFPAVKRALSPTSMMDGSKESDVESYADTYFNEIGFKVGENSCMGSTESPDLDDEEMLYKSSERSMGLLDDSSLATDIERAVASGVGEGHPGRPKQKPQSQQQQQQPPHKQQREELKRPKSRNGLSIAKAYNAPFHSYFGQLVNDDGPIVSPSAYDISYHSKHVDDVSISTLGEDSIKRKPSPMYAQQRSGPPTSKEKKAPPDSLDLKQARTGSTLEERPSEDSNERSKKNAKHSRQSSAARSAPQVVEPSEKRWRLIYFVIGTALILLATASVVLGFTIVQLKNSQPSKAQAPSSTWMPSIHHWTSSPTASPTEPPSKKPSPQSSTVDAAIHDLLQMINAVSPDSLNSINDTSAPQYQAFEWTINDPEYMAYSVDQVLQRWAMAVIYFSLGGEGWSMPPRRLAKNESSSVATQVDWLSYSNECLWYTTDTERNNVCNDAGGLITLQLVNTGLVGTIPPEIALLGGTLERLNFENNDVNGTLPTELGDLTHLVDLQLTSNEIEGIIPSKIGALSNLVVVNLGRNRLTGSLPASLGGLQKLTNLACEDNALDGTIPSEIGELSALEILSLDANNFEGTIPPVLGMLRNLHLFSVYQNDLNGTMPYEFCLANETGVVLGADCMEVECECCTLCCYGCDRQGNGSLIERTPLPTAAPMLVSTGVPSPRPTSTSTSSPTGLFDALKPALAAFQGNRKQAPTTSPTGPSIIKGEQSNQPSSIPSEAPSVAPTGCETNLTVLQSCYQRAGQNIQVAFRNCASEPGDWFGLFPSDYFLSNPVGSTAPRTTDTALWVRPCGNRLCSVPTASGTVTLGNALLRQKAGNYRIVLVRQGITIATSQAFQISSVCS